jgi:hypothetical protein
MGHRGKRRRVVELLGRELVNPGELDGRGRYVFTVRMDCGHTTKAKAQTNTRDPASTPRFAFCRDPECVVGRAVAA